VYIRCLWESLITDTESDAKQQRKAQFAAFALAVMYP